jgi:hypothetical protein
MPEAMRRTMAENEHFVLAVARAPLPDGVDDDLLAGLAAETQTPAAPLDVDTLRNELAGRRAYLAVCEGYLKNVIDPAFAQALQQYADQEQEIIHHLARALRLAGEPTAEIASDPELIARGAGLETIGDRQGFLLAGVRQALIRWEAHEAAATGQTEAGAPGGGEQTFWNALRMLAEEQVKTLTSFR